MKISLTVSALIQPQPSCRRGRKENKKERRRVRQKNGRLKQRRRDRRGSERRGNLVLVVKGIQEGVKVAEFILLEVVSDGGKHSGVEALALQVRGGALTVHQLACIWGDEGERDKREGWVEERKKCEGGGARKEDTVDWSSLHSSGWTMIPNVWSPGTSRVSAILPGKRRTRGGRGGEKEGRRRVGR